jgi:hypothetical protein
MPALTAEQIRIIASEALADVAQLKITTSKSGEGFTYRTRRMYPVVSTTKGPTIGTIARKTLINSKASGIQMPLAGSVLSLAEARDYFKEAFNKVRKS